MVKILSDIVTNLKIYNQYITGRFREVTLWRCQYQYSIRHRWHL